MRKSRPQLVFPREVLLVEIERRCPVARCNAKNRIGLTKEEARVYRGYTCVRCEQQHEDVLTERDVPDWWEELAVTGLTGLRARLTGHAPAGPATDDASGVVGRMSAAWRARELSAADSSAAAASAGASDE
ncbi:MAG TPA: hypothetical protein VF525_17010 [Pyrinomonadaceae bacterium]|jgi:hypothetical protein